MRIALLQVNPTVGDLAGNAYLDALRIASAAAPSGEPRPSCAGRPSYRDLLPNRGFVDRS
jgi:hypothetical protein